MAAALTFLLAISGHVLAAGQRTNPTIADLELAVQAHPDSADAHLRLGSAYYKKAFPGAAAETADLKSAQAAVEAYQVASALGLKLTLKNYFRYYHAVARCHEALGRHQDALSALKKAISLDSSNYMPNLYAAQVRRRMGDYAASSANLLVSVRRAQRSRRVPLLARRVRTDPYFAGLLGVPQNQVILKAYEGAQAGVLGRAEADRRIQEAAMRTAGIPVLARREVPDDLRDSVSASAPDGSPRPILTVKEGKEALARADPKSAAVWLRIGASYRQLGNTGDAVRALERAAAAAPQSAEVQYQLALSQAAHGAKNEALASLNRAFNAASPEELSGLMTRVQSDPEVESLRDLPTYRDVLLFHSLNLSARR